METLLLVGTAVFWLAAAASGIAAVVAGMRLTQHMRNHHHEHWQRIYEDQQVKKTLLWPFMRDTPVDFLWKSNETFGDRRIGDLRRQAKRGFYGFLLAGVAGMAWFGIIALWLDSRR
jgi:hypothetical protein